MGELYQKIKDYVKEDYYPYHMPGHKRNLFGSTAAPIADIDITEIEGFDNLHDAKEILKRLQEKAAAVYGAEESFYLVNGSTSGILSAVSAALPEKGKLLMDRGCHKAAYHAVYLRNLEAKYLWGGQNREFGCSLAVTAEQVEHALLQDGDIQAVLIVSPTYEGVVADVAAIAEVTHKRGIPLIVDEAHGAHLGYHPAWPQNSCRQGADLVVNSIHKTLLSMTQTAILHVNGDLIDRKKLKRFLQIYQSSSPSYVLMAAMEEAIEIASSRSEELFGVFLKRWKVMTDRLAECKCIRFLQEKNRDIGKLVIADSSGQLSGQQLYTVLLERYHLQMEMAAGNYVLAMFTIGDREEGYERLTNALLEIDEECSKRTVTEKRNQCRKKSNAAVTKEAGLSYRKRRLSLKEAWDCEAEEIPLDKSFGRIAGEFVCLYPPGVPLMVPGEEFTKDICLCIQKYIEMGLTVQGIEKREEQVYVSVLKQ